MSRIHWPEGTQFERIVLAPEDRFCGYCGRFTRVDDNNHRYLRALGGPLHVVTKVCRRPDPGCPGHRERQGEDTEMSIAPPFWTVSWDLFARLGHRRFSRHWSVPQICAELADRYGMVVSADVVEDDTAKYETMVAARESNLVRLVAAYAEIPDLLLSIDGLQPEKGHGCLYVVREKEPCAEAPGLSQDEQVVLDYCAAVRGVLNDDQGGPLRPPGVRMAEALGEIKDSITRARAAKKGGPATEA